MKKQISILLSVLLLLSFYAPVNAEEVTEYELWTESRAKRSSITKFA